MNSQAAVSPSPAEAAFGRHVAAFANHDIDAVMADYGEDSVFVTPQGVFEGKAAIRSLFDGLIAEFSAPGTTLKLHEQHASGALVHVTWSAETPQNRYAFATDTLFVVDGLIRWQTFAAVVTPK
ncbi:MAG: nuclear transport factor 2 family protein [Burkholderiaceae bacterium]|nr:nuclear transport factor 2 family protein [Burkholderiaceae bacterium]